MPRTGRPRVFDRDEALEAAMRVFWKRGYAGATTEELLDAMGKLTPPSLYHAFGSKEELFKAAVDRYAKAYGVRPVAAMEAAPTARDGVSAMLYEALRLFTGEARGCLLVSGATKCVKGAEEASAYVRNYRRKAPAAIRARIERGQRQGDVAANADPAAIASFYTTVLHGLAVRAGDDVSRKDLTAAVEGALAAWPKLAG